MATLVADARTTYADVSDVIATTLTQSQVNAFINSAHAIIDAALLSAGYSDALLKEIETWLAAHLLSVRDMRAHAESIGDYSVTYQGTSGLGLDATLYGQQVKLLDTAGLLANLGQRAASLTVH